METLLDIKKALMKAPDDLLKNIWFGCGENCEDEISMVAGEGTGDFDFPQVFSLIEKKYPELDEFNQLIKNIAKAQEMINKCDDCVTETLNEGEPMTDTFFDKNKEVN